MNIYVYCNPFSGLIVRFLLMLYLCLNMSTSTVKSCMEEERRSLLTFKQDLIDPSGRLSSWVGNQCCRWRGISCNNSTGHVVKVDLRNTNAYNFQEYLNFTEYHQSFLGGKLNRCLLRLKQLTYLDLSSNNFQEIHIPNFFGQLTNLRYLNLSYASSSGGEIPPSLGNLSNLNYLDLNSNNLGVSSKNLNWLSHLPSLKYLNLGRVNLSNTGLSWLHHVNMLPSLLELHLSRCQIRNFPFSLQSVNFTSLLVLDLSSNYIDEFSLPSWFFNLTTLVELDLGGNVLSDPFSINSTSLKSLEHLDLSNCRLQGQLPKLGENLCRLKSLSLRSNHFDRAVISEFMSGFANCSYNRMESLDLSHCGLVCELPTSLGMLRRLQYLDLSFNSLRGSIPKFIISNLSSSLKTLDLSYNLFNGSIPETLGQLSQLVSLDISENSWEGTLVEAHFINLTNLESLLISTNRAMPIIFNFTNYNWIPPFKLRRIEMDNCRVGPAFPVWLQSQTKLLYVIVRNAGISDAIPEEWLSSHINFMDLSNNNISGKLPFRFNFANIHYIDLSNNQFDGTIPSSICSIQSLIALSLRNNQLSGKFPQEWSLWSNIAHVDVSNNNLSGNIPTSMGIPTSLRILKMDNNRLSGEIPSALQNCSRLERLYLGGNKFTGSIPFWIGSQVSTLQVLQLRSNLLSGHIPEQLCNLPYLQILDLGHNNFSRTIPKCLINLTSLVVHDISAWSIYHCQEPTIVTLKGREMEYSKSDAKFLTIIDLSSNNLQGEIPEEISSLFQLGTLNLSMNQLSGNIPSNIGNLHLLETLDFSHNQLSGLIPQSLSNLTFLSHLNLSYNNLIGRIPSGNQLQTLDDSSIYDGNPLLCGFPLKTKCPKDGDDMLTAEVNKDHNEKLGFYTSSVLGFVIGFWGVCGTLILNESWRYAYFQFFDNIKDKVALTIALKVARWEREV